jgi:hypothetical protein
MPDPLEVLSKIALHFNGHPVLQEVISLGQELWRKVAQTLLGIRAVGSASKIHFGIHKSMTAFFAQACCVVLEKFHFIAALGALDFKDRPRLPVTAILSGTFHVVLSNKSS